MAPFRLKSCISKQTRLCQTAGLPLERSKRRDVCAHLNCCSKLPLQSGDIPSANVENWSTPDPCLSSNCFTSIVMGCLLGRVRQVKQRGVDLETQFLQVRTLFPPVKNLVKDMLEATLVNCKSVLSDSTNAVLKEHVDPLELFLRNCDSPPPPPVVCHILLGTRGHAGVFRTEGACFEVAQKVLLCRLFHVHNHKVTMSVAHFTNLGCR